MHRPKEADQVGALMPHQRGPASATAHLARAHPSVGRNCSAFGVALLAVLPARRDDALAAGTSLSSP